MTNREFLQKAHVFQPEKHRIAGWFVSEKLDGFRCWWDGGITRGKPCDQVPFANIAKHSRYIVKPLATGLWSSYANPVQAPSWFLDALPVGFSLDGELWGGVGKFQYVASTIKKLIPEDYAWRQIQFRIFDGPSLGQVLQDGRCNNTNYKKDFAGFANGLASSQEMFITTLARLERQLEGSDSKIISLEPQIRLSLSTAEAQEQLNEFLNQTCSQGGEGVILRNPASIWTPRRMNSILKLKPFLDSEGLVIGYTTGRETDKGSKLRGLMGNLVLSWQGKEFELSGFTDDERKLTSVNGDAFAFNWAYSNPGSRVPADIWATSFPRNTTVTFRFRELTDAGIPKESRFWRKP